MNKLRLMIAALAVMSFALVGCKTVETAAGKGVALNVGGYGVSVVVTTPQE